MGRLLLFPARRENPAWHRYKRQTASLTAQKLKLIAQRQMLDELSTRLQKARDAKASAAIGPTQIRHQVSHPILRFGLI